MANEIVVSKSLVPVKGIKYDFQFYFWMKGTIVTQNNVLDKFLNAERLYDDVYFNDAVQMKAKYRVVLSKQKEIIGSYYGNSNCNNLLQNMQKLLKEGNINKFYPVPKRLLPTLQVLDTREYLKKKYLKKKCDNGIKRRLVVLNFNEALISFLEQKEGYAVVYNRVISYLKKLNEHTDGVEFDEYIDDWVKEIMAKRVMQNE